VSIIRIYLLKTPVPLATRQYLAIAEHGHRMDRRNEDSDAVEVQDEVYDENEDEDFNPEDDDDAFSSSSDEDDSATRKGSKGVSQKRKTEEIDGLDSGDEATIRERKRKRKKKSTEEGEKEDEGDGAGEDGYIMTRAQRMAEKTAWKERKRTGIGEVTIDVNKVWEKLSNIPIGKTSPQLPQHVEIMDERDEHRQENIPVGGDMITIKRRIKYAGEVTEVEETVPRSSKSGQQYLKEHPEADPDQKGCGAPETEIRRPLKRPSMFEPNPTAMVKGVPPEKLRPKAPSRLDVLLAEKKAEKEMKLRAENMTTVQKSALDWRGFVDQQGLRQELDEYGKSKRGYLEREEFLGRADMAREIAARDARLKG